MKKSFRKKKSFRMMKKTKGGNKRFHHLDHLLNPESFLFTRNKSQNYSMKTRKNKPFKHRSLRGG